jgi:hypothetical protein
MELPGVADPPPAVPPLVLAGDVDHILLGKRSHRDSGEESQHSSDTERRIRREKFEEALRSAQWDVGSSSDSIRPSSSNYSPATTPSRINSSIETTPKRFYATPPLTSRPLSARSRQPSMTSPITMIFSVYDT